MNFKIIYIQQFFWLWMTFTAKCNQVIDDGYVELCKPNGYYGCECPDYTIRTNTSSLDCSDRGLTNTSQFIQFPDFIHEVNFKNNKIESILQNTIVLGRNVIKLDLSYNRIHFIHHSVFQPLETLQTLILSHNSICSLDPNLFDGLQSLQTLDLSYNRVQSWDNQLFNPCKRLKHLDLRYNAIGSSGLTSRAFEALPRLQTLNLENTGITELPDTIFASNYELKYLYLNGNPMKKVPNIALQSAISLTFLDISATNVQIIQYEDFIGLKSLTQIRLERLHRLVSVEMNAFSDLINLQSFVCRHNYQLIQIHEKAFTNNMTGEAIRLVDLDLRYNSLQTLGSQLVLWEALHHIDLEGNPWICDCNTEWMAHLSAKHLSLSNTTCHQPLQLSGQLINSLSAQDFVCQSSVVSHSLLISLILLITLLTLAISATVFIKTSNSCCSRRCHVFNTNTDINYLRVNNNTADIEWDSTAEP